jgi:outer membrane receptor protein involved in Fe transport
LLPNETGQGVDLGFKWSFFDGRMALITGVYSAERNDVLQTVFDEELDRNVLVPDGQVQTDGIEIELNWQATKGLQILAGYGYSDNRLTKNPERPELVGKPGARGVGPYNFGLRTIYHFQSEALQGFSVRGSIRGQGKSLGEYGGGPYLRGGIQYPNDNRVNIWQPAWEVVDVGAGYNWRNSGSRWRHSLNLNLKNVLNEEYSIGNWNPQDKFSFSLTYSVRL